MKFNKQEKQVFCDLLPILETELQNKISIIRQFKWLCAINQSGEDYRKNKNVWELQDTAIKRLENEYNYKRGVVLRIINSPD